MSQVSDQNKLRREYLRKKSVNLVGAGVAGNLLLVCLLGMALSALYAIVSSEEIREGTPDPDFGSYDVVAGGLSMLIFAALSWLCWRIIRHLQSNVKKLPFVAAVTPDTFPADEILVRGSEAPVQAQRDVLLRAAMGQETPQEELLRVSQE
jgi:hypothetical protein